MMTHSEILQLAIDITYLEEKNLEPYSKEEESLLRLRYSLMERLAYWEWEQKNGKKL
jgi:hypothetical protein